MVDGVKILMLRGEKGESGTSGDYAGLTNKPRINGIELNGNKTASGLGLMTQTDAEAQRDAIAQFETNVQADVADMQTDIDSFKDSVNETIDGMQSDLDILGARTQTYDITDNIYVSGSKSPRVGSLSIKASKTGNVVSFTSIWYLNASSVSADCQIYRQYAPKKAMDFPVINNDTNECVGWAYFDGTDDLTNNEVTISLQLASAYASQSMSVMLDATYVCDDVEKYYESNPNAIVIQDGSVTTSKLAGGAVTYAKVNSDFRNIIPFLDYTDEYSSGSYDLDDFDRQGNWCFNGVTVTNAPNGCSGTNFSLTVINAVSAFGSWQIVFCEDGKRFERYGEQGDFAEWNEILTRKKLNLVYDETADGTKTSYEVTGSFIKAVAVMSIPASASTVVFRCEADGTLLGYITSQTNASREGAILADCSEGLLMSQFVLNANANSVGAINAYPSRFEPKDEINTIRFVLNTGAVIPSDATMKVYAY